MRSPEWFRRRELWVEQYRLAHGGQEPVCAVCGAAWTLRDGQLHHRSYARLGAEAWQDLLPVCCDDHAALDALMERNPAWRKIPREQASDMIVAYLRSKTGTVSER
ncbi:MAG: hypothetical protein ACLP50_01525 [Solirubrobacteraceae bacterium]